MSKAKTDKKDHGPVNQPNLNTVPIEEQQPLLENIMYLLRPVRREFKSGLLGDIKQRQHFISPAERDRLKRGKSRKGFANSSRKRLEILDTDPFYRILAISPSVDRKINHTEFKPQSRRITDDLGLDLIASSTGAVPIAVVQDRVVSVFVVAKILSNPAKFVIQKIAKKSAKGFPGGTIEHDESVLDCADREFLEESRDREERGGVSINRYAPAAIGDFELNMAQAGERGAVVYVELPVEERHNLRVGGGQVAEEECVEHIYLPTFEQVENLANNQELLPNSITVWYVYKKFFGLI